MEIFHQNNNCYSHPNPVMLGLGENDRIATLTSSTFFMLNSLFISDLCIMLICNLSL